MQRNLSVALDATARLSVRADDYDKILSTFFADNAKEQPKPKRSDGTVWEPSAAPNRSPADDAAAARLEGGEPRTATGFNCCVYGSPESMASQLTTVQGIVDELGMSDRVFLLDADALPARRHTL